MSKLISQLGEVTLLDILGDALDGQRGLDQQRIASVGLRWIVQILAKNTDYGSSVWKAPLLCPGLDVSEAIFVRMTDKIERIRRLRERLPEVTGESLEDTVADLGSYCLLWLARPIERDVVEAARAAEGEE